MDKEVAPPPQHPQRRKQAGQAEAMVAMRMGDEDVPDAVETNPHPAHLQLGTLATINHIQLVAQVDDLRRGQVPHRGQRRPAS